jgi:hypothetical protein
MEVTDATLKDLTARLEALVARCKGRDKTIFNELAELKEE